MLTNSSAPQIEIVRIEIDLETILTIEQADQISRREAILTLSNRPDFRHRINQGSQYLHTMLHEEGCIYGVTTGYGENCVRSVPLNLVPELPLHLSRFHGCGLGAYLSVSQTRLVLAVRLISLCRGVSGVTFELLERLQFLLEHDILPVIPSEGSVGASGDLTPLSYIAAVVCGERDVWYKGERRSTLEVYKELEILPHTLRPKEALALMNGTSVMTALAVEAFCRAHYLSQLATRLTAMTSLALEGNPHHYHAKLFEAKPHPGQMIVASRLRQDLKNAPETFPTARLQDRYSTRCAPHIIGVLEDLLPTFRTLIETEMNSANDNPLIQLEEEGTSGQILHGGNFYGGHIAFAMDSLKNLVANLADLMDRQMATLVDPNFNNGLPSNLSGVIGPRAAINHGLKALQIGASAWTAEALKNTMPASVFSRSTESHNQDKVSMGTIAARDALRVLELTEQVAIAQTIASLQALRLRVRDHRLTHDHFSEEMRVFVDQLCQEIPFIEEDIALEQTLRQLLLRLRARSWTLYDK